MYPALAVYAAGLAVLSQAESLGMLVVAALLIGLGFGTVMPTGQAAAVRLAQPHNIGLAVSTFYLLLDLGTGLGPVVLGGLVSTWDYRLMYLAVAGLVLATGLHYHLVHGRHRERARRG